MIQRAVKKPVEIEFIIFEDKLEVISEISDWINQSVDCIKVSNTNPDKPQMIIPTLEGDHFADVGDYIIRGVKGEFYPCKPDIFKLTYDILK